MSNQVDIAIYYWLWEEKAVRNITDDNIGQILMEGIKKFPSDKETIVDRLKAYCPRFKDKIDKIMVLL
jgi:hypothetical protein